MALVCPPCRSLALAAAFAALTASNALAQATSANPARWFNIGARQAPPSRLDGDVLVMNPTGPAALWAGLGPYLPDSARIEATVTITGCASGGDARAGIAFANTGRDNPMIFELKGLGTAVLMPMATVGISLNGWPPYVAGASNRVAVDIAGRTAVVFVNGREIGRETFDRSLAGAFGVVADGVGCEVRYSEMRVHFLRGLRPAAPGGAAAVHDGLALLDTAGMATRTSGQLRDGTIVFSATQGTLLNSRVDAVLGDPSAVEATMQQAGCTSPGAAMGIAFGAGQGRSFAVLEIVDQQWSLRTLGGMGVAGLLPANLVRRGEPLRLRVATAGTVATATVNGHAIGALDLERALDGRFGVIRSGCETVLRELKVSRP